MAHPIPPPHGDPAGAARAAASHIAAGSGVARHHVALVLGSGWSGAIDRLGPASWQSPSVDVPGFLPPSVAGHPGSIRSVVTGSGARALVFAGRTHLYEGHGVEAVVHGVRTAAAAGCRAVVLTNAAGGLHPGWGPGTPVLISDHINLTGQSPLRGPAFLDLTDLYSPRLRELCLRVDPGLDEGVYLQVRGPQYETPAEVRMAGRLGADLVGMSTALEAIAAREAGLEILGLSLVANAAAGVTGHAVQHDDVLAAGRQAAGRIGALLAAVVERL